MARIAYSWNYNRIESFEIGRDASFPSHLCLDMKMLTTDSRHFHKDRNYFEDPFARQIDDDSRCEYLIDHHASITRESLNLSRFPSREEEEETG